MYPYKGASFIEDPSSDNYCRQDIYEFSFTALTFTTIACIFYLPWIHFMLYTNFKGYKVLFKPHKFEDYQSRGHIVDSYVSRWDMVKQETKLFFTRCWRMIKGVSVCSEVKGDGDNAWFD